MTTLALALVLAAAIAHASWNYLAKCSRDVQAFTWAFTAVATLVCAPLALVSAWRSPLPLSTLSFAAGTIVLHLFYFGLLGASYARADLSVVYPVARGTGLLLIPIGAVVLLGEHVSLPGVGAIATILVGVLVVHTRGGGVKGMLGGWRSLGDPGSRLAALTGVVIASYTLWDKNALGQQVSPIVIDTAIFAGQAAFNAPRMLGWRRRAVLSEVRSRPGAVVAAGILSPLAYFLVLQALTFSRVAYVAPARELGIVVGALLGARQLKEPYAANRLVGAALIVAGVFGLALAP